MNLSTNGNQQPGQNKVVQTMRSRIYGKVEDDKKKATEKGQRAEEKIDL